MAQDNDSNKDIAVETLPDESTGEVASQSPAAPWRARNIYSHINVKRKSVDRFIFVILIMIALLIAWFAFNTKGLPVKFETYGGTQIEEVRYMYGDLIERPEDPKLEGYKFVDWYPNEALIAPWNFTSDKVSGEMTLHAKWEAKTAEDNRD